MIRFSRRGEANQTVIAIVLIVVIVVALGIFLYQWTNSNKAGDDYQIPSGTQPTSPTGTQPQPQPIQPQPAPPTGQ
ncbi:MAG TPA: hypothetical protein PLU88_04820 [Armatimonadota bacterium]|nr:hypothetical protein [Armatimonadota bacterium]HOP80974.1 hypothetical protein [Armatimonadota bacterium]HPP74431.1 hypothetical protein [Armatimonadota bacterium]